MVARRIVHPTNRRRVLLPKQHSGQSVRSVQRRVHRRTFAASNTDIINSGSAQPGLLFQFTDCTTFADSAITENKGQYEQAKSINYQITDSAGTGLTGALVAVYDVDNAIQTGIQTSTSGAVPQINARFFRQDHGSAAVTKSPFTIRIRKYGYTYLGFSSTVADKIDQEVRLVDNTTLVSTEAQAAAITGISLNFSTETVTITEDCTTQRLYDYYQYQLAQSANMAYGEDLVRSGDSFNLDDWDMTVDGCTYTGDVTTTGTVSVINSGVFNGDRTDTNGTVFADVQLTFTGLKSGTEVQIHQGTTQIVFEENITDGDFVATVPAITGSINVHVMANGYQFVRFALNIATADITIPVSQPLDRQYENP